MTLAVGTGADPYTQAVNRLLRVTRNSNTGGVPLTEGALHQSARVLDLLLKVQIIYLCLCLFFSFFCFFFLLMCFDSCILK